MAGNLFGAEVETPRNDASYGTLMTNDGNGNIQYIPNYHHKLNVKGEVRHLKMITLAGGKKAIVVAKNNEQIQIVQYD